MKALTTTLLTLLSFCSSLAQHRQVLPVGAAEPTGKDTENIWQFTLSPALSDGPFLAFSLRSERNAGEEAWSVTLLFPSGMEQAFVLEHDPHAFPGAAFVSRLYFAGPGASALRIRYAGRHPASPAALHLYQPGHSPAVSQGVPSENGAGGRSACPCPLPPSQSRNDWCPDGSCPPDPSPTSTTVTHLIVHHSAGPTSAADWAAVVRSFWDFHVNVNGWADIGYNWLVDPNGVIYDGRGNNITGAHFCGANSNTAGICVIGDFTDEPPTAAALQSLHALLAWKCCDASLDPLSQGYHVSSSKVLYRISGHRDGCSTSCPGDAFYPMLPTQRQAVRGFIDSNCSDPPPPPAAPTLLTASAVTPYLVQLSWADNSSDEMGFSLERSSPTNGSYTVLASLPANTTDFDDLTVEPGTDYYYRVRAQGNGPASDFSNEAFVTTLPVATKERMESSALWAFPNPAADLLRIVLNDPPPGQALLRVFDSRGAFLFREESHEGQWRLNVSTWPPGMYLLHVAAGEQTYFRKIVKQ